jgi:hypothetical protein
MKYRAKFKTIEKMSQKCQITDTFGSFYELQWACIDTHEQARGSLTIQASLDLKMS